MMGRLLLMLALLMPVESMAQAVGTREVARLAPGDELQASVPGRPDLTTRLTIDESGRVSLPQIGDVELAGLTLSEAEMVLRQKLRLADMGIDSVDLALVSQAGTIRMFVIGDVAHPGEFTFSTLPTLWELVRTCGGPNTTANLSQCRIIRQVEGLPQVQTVDLTGILDGTATPTATLLDGDTLVIPALLDGVSGVRRNEGVQVFGGVGVPTTVAISEPMPMLDVLMLAGAPTLDANLEKIWLVHQTGDKYISRQVNMALYMQEGDPMGNPLVYPGDSLQIEVIQPSWVRRTLPFVLGSLAAVATILLAWDRLYRE